MVNRLLASDNYAGLCPEALQALIEANAGRTGAYGDDVWTSRAQGAFRALFGCDLASFLVFNGTAANALAVAAICRSYHAVLCADVAHVANDECGAPGFFAGGVSLITTPAPDGKLTPDDVRRMAHGRRFVHTALPRMLTITQPTESGCLYTPDEVAALGELCRELGLVLHMDGARFANAVAALGCTPAALTWQAGVDVLSFGGTKNGVGTGEAVLFFDQALAEGFDLRRKQAGQLASKMRFLAAPWTAVLQGGAWLRHAAHANGCAARFAAACHGLQGVDMLFPVQANAVFLRLAPGLAQGLRDRGWVFYDFYGDAARFMFAWDSDPADGMALAEDLARLARARHAEPEFAS